MRILCLRACELGSAASKKFEAFVEECTKLKCDRLSEYDGLTTLDLRNTFPFVTVLLSLSVSVNASRSMGR
jgi:hypothetical protein